MNGGLNRTWWLLALCGILDAMQAAVNLLMVNPDGAVALRRLALPGAVWDMGVLGLAAGGCAVAAGLWNVRRDYAWLLSLHGLALGAYGAIAVSPLVRGPLSFRPVSLLFAAMAASAGAFALKTAQTVRRGASKGRLLSAAGVISICFAASFIAVGFQLVRLRPPAAFFIWMSSYFGVCAILMLGLAFRADSRELPRRSSRMGPLSPLPSARHAH